MLNPLHLRTLIHVVRHGSFAGAARALGYTSSAISQQMVQLERSVRIPLFERTAQSTRPTAAAEVLANLAEEIISKLETLAEEVEAIAAGRVGRLRVGSFPSASSRLVSPAMAAFAQAFPGVTIQFVENNPHGLVDILQAAQIDIAVVHVYDLSPHAFPAEFRQVPILREDLLLLGPPGTLSARRPVRLGDLEDEQWICTNEGSPGETMLLRACAEVGFVPNIAIRSLNFGAIQALASDGMGFAFVPALGFNARIGGPDVAEPVDLSTHRRVVALYRSDDHNPAIRGFLQVLHEVAERLEEDLGITAARSSLEQ